MPVRITAVSGGNCLTFNGSAIQNRSPNNIKEQLWIVEKEREGSDKVGIRNKANGHYLRAKTGNAYQQLELSTSRQWWKLEPGKAPGSYFVRCTDFKDAYLCNCKGLALVDPNQVYIWPRTNQERVWVHAITWYLQDSDSPGFEVGQVRADLGKSEEEVKTNGQAIADREKELARQSKEFEQKLREVDAKLQAAKDKEDSLTKREESIELRERTSDSLSSEDKTERDEELRKWAKDLGEREKRLQKEETRDIEDQAAGDAAEHTERSDSEIEEENKQLKAQIEEFKKKTLFSRISWNLDDPSSKFYLSRRTNKSGLAPSAKKPGPQLPKDWNPDLLQRWEAGKKTMVGRGR